VTGQETPVLTFKVPYRHKMEKPENRKKKKKKVKPLTAAGSHKGLQ
jgi:hypothetical protein